MSLINPAEIPGYAEAVEKEQTTRDLAFLATPLPLCGIKVRQFTPRHWIMLLRSGNAFICGGRITANDILMFVWYVSEEYCLDLEKRDAFLTAFMEKAAETKPVDEINSYLDDAFYDMDRSGGELGLKKIYTATIAGIVDVLAREYGWDDEAILEKPMARLFQYLRRIHHRNNPNKMLFNRSEKLISDWTRRN